MNTHTFARSGSGQSKVFKGLVMAALLISALSTAAFAQDQPRQRQPRTESFGNTLNLGVGIGYFGYIGYAVPFVFANYEFNVARDFTLAPFIGFASYRSYEYYRYAGYDYYYHETVVPIGVKGTYYFDRILGAGPKWDFYLAASVGFVVDRVVWDNGYGGDRGVSRSSSPLYLDGHIGTEYHFSRKVGLFLDLSTGVSTLGIAIHGR